MQEENHHHSISLTENNQLKNKCYTGLWWNHMLALAVLICNLQTSPSAHHPSPWKENMLTCALSFDNSQTRALFNTTICTLSNTNTWIYTFCHTHTQATDLKAENSPWQDAHTPTLSLVGNPRNPSHEHHWQHSLQNNSVGKASHSLQNDTTSYGLIPPKHNCVKTMVLQS